MAVPNFSFQQAVVAGVEVSNMESLAFLMHMFSVARSFMLNLCILSDLWCTNSLSLLLTYKHRRKIKNFLCL
jgi:hypothetical protein